MSSIATTKISGGANYAKVADRLKDFRETHPRASIKTEPKPYGEGGMMIKAYILTDKGDETSADAEGTAAYTANEMKQSKAFEKLETIAVGRALSLLGWLNNGEIASTEEIEEFERMKQKNQEEQAKKDVAAIEAAKTMQELIAAWNKSDKRNDIVIAAKDKRKVELSENTATGTK